MAKPKKYADGGEVKKPPPPPQMGGQAGKAQKALSGRSKQIEDAVGYKNGGVVKKKRK